MAAKIWRADAAVDGNLMSHRLPTRWIDDTEGLEELGRSLDRCPRLALDTESNSGFSYSEKLCLLQVNDGSAVWLVDLLALPGGQRSLERLRTALESPDRIKYLHGGEFDVGCLKRDFDISLCGIWDTQQASSFLGWEKTSYGALVEKLCGVKLPKAHTLHDWSQRPIEGAELEYAIHDVLYLPEVADHLRRQVDRADLDEEVQIACRAVEQATWNGGFKPEGLWSIRGARKLEVRQQGMLMALYLWREALARDLDLPPGRALNNEVLLALARSAPSDIEELERVGLPRRIDRERYPELLGCVAEARRDPPELPPPPVSEPLDRSVRKRGDRLKSWRRQEAERRGVPLQVVLPLAAMRHLTRHGADALEEVPQLGSKRIRLYGDVLRELASTPI